MSCDGRAHGGHGAVARLNAAKVACAMDGRQACPDVDRLRRKSTLEDGLCRKQTLCLATEKTAGRTSGDAGPLKGLLRSVQGRRIATAHELPKRLVLSLLRRRWIRHLEERGL